jgi:hypothetical protein
MTPTHTATVFVALAGIGGTPLNKRAGNEMKLPPPATAFSTPPMALATKSRIMVCRLKV